MIADLVFAGGPVFMADSARPRASAVAVRDGRILAIGHDEVRELVGPSTEVVDLRGRMLVPGFQDAHVHPIWGGLDMLRCDLGPRDTQAEHLARIARYATAHPDEEWIVGGGWGMSSFPGGTPLASALDTVLPDRPLLTNRDGHGAWVNSAALRLAGIDAETPDPADGRIERLPDGAPSGTLHEGAMALVNRLLPVTSEDRMLEALLLGQQYLHSFGITGWQDAIVGAGYGDAGDPVPAYLRASREGRLTGRVVGALWWDRGRGLEQIDELIDKRATLTVDRFRATSVKVMQDGVAENFTAAMLAPYGDGHGHPTDNSGISFVDPEILNEAVARLDALSFQVHVHAIGDRAVREALDAAEVALIRNGPRDNRHHIAHLQVVHPDDVPRFGRLGVTANLQMLWAALEPQMVELTLPFFTAERAAWQYPFGDLMRSGATLAAGSDWSVSTPNPFAAMHVAVNRRSAPGEGLSGDAEFLPEQRLDLATTMTAYTEGSARVNHQDDTGVIAVGKLADLAVLDRDPCDAPDDEIGLTRVLATYIDGVRVFGEA